MVMQFHVLFLECWQSSDKNMQCFFKIKEWLLKNWRQQVKKSEGAKQLEECAGPGAATGRGRVRGCCETGRGEKEDGHFFYCLYVLF